MAELVHYVRALESGAAIDLQVSRNGDLIGVNVKLSWHS